MHLSRPHVRLAASILLAGLILAGTISVLRSATHRVQVRLAYPHVPSSALLFVADRLGYFRAEGLDVQLQPFTIGRDALSSMIHGNADAAVAYEMPILFAACDGAPIRILTVLHSSERTTGIVARTDRGIHGPKDLAGKRIGIVHTTNAELVLWQILRLQNLSLNAVQIVELEPDAVIDALIRGDVDAISVWTPLLQDAQARMGTGVTKPMFSDLYTDQSMLVTKSHSTLPAVSVEHLLRALSRADQFISDHPEQAERIVESVFPAPQRPAVAVMMQNANFHVGLNNVLAGSLERSLQWLQAEHIAECKQIHSARSLIDTSALEKADPTAVTIR